MDNSRANNQIQKEKHKRLVFLKSLVHFSEQKLNSQNYYIRAINYVHLSPLSYIISCSCHVAQNVFI